MPRLINVREGTREGEKGFFHTYEMVGATEVTAEQKAKVAAASRYPLKAVGTDVTASKRVGDMGGGLGAGNIGEWQTTVFVPEKGLKEEAREKAMELAEKLGGE